MSHADSTREQQRKHLAQVQALSREIASALSAIEKNDLRQFEKHVAAQEAICNSVSPAQKLLPPAPAGSGSGVELDPDRRLSGEIRQAHESLAQLNRVYAAVLKRAEKTLGLVAAIYRAHGQGYDRSPSPIAKHHTWSCEV